MNTEILYEISLFIVGAGAALSGATALGDGSLEIGAGLMVLGGIGLCAGVVANFVRSYSRPQRNDLFMWAVIGSAALTLIGVLLTSIPPA